MKKYPALSLIASLLRLFGILIIICGIILSVYVIASGKAVLGSNFGLSPLILGIIGIIFSFIIGLPIYSMGDLYQCIMDIESNTRRFSPQADKSGSVVEKQRQIAELQSEISKELKNRQAQG